MFLWIAISLFIGDLIFISMIVKGAAPYGDFEFPHDTYAKDVYLPKEKMERRKENWRTEMTDYGLSCFVVGSLAAASFCSFFEVSFLYLIIPTVAALFCVPLIVFIEFLAARKEVGFFSFLFKIVVNFFKNVGSCFLSKWYEYIALIVVISIYISSLSYFGTEFFL